MLGWSVYLYRHGQTERENAIANWKRGSVVVDWIERLAKQGFAKDCGGTGYPWIFTVKAEIVLPPLKSKSYDQPLHEQLGAALLPPLGLTHDVVINRKLMKGIAGTEELIVHAWDLS